MGGWDRWRVVDLYQGMGEGTGGGYYPIVFFNCVFVFWSLMPCLFFKWVEHIAVVSVSLLFVFFVSGPFN